VITHTACWETGDFDVSRKVYAVYIQLSDNIGVQHVIFNIKKQKGQTSWVLLVIAYFGVFHGLCSETQQKPAVEQTGTVKFPDFSCESIAI
jgi:hypothetical protein